jgi:hypothetical protein
MSDDDISNVRSLTLQYGNLTCSHSPERQQEGSWPAGHSQGKTPGLPGVALASHWTLCAFVCASVNSTSEDTFVLCLWV